MIIISPHLKLCGTGQFYICSHSRIKARSATLDQYWHRYQSGESDLVALMCRLKHYLSLFVAQIKAESCCSDFPFSKAKEEVTEVRCFFLGGNLKCATLTPEVWRFEQLLLPDGQRWLPLTCSPHLNENFTFEASRLKNTLTHIYNFQIWGLKVFTSSREALPSLNIQIHTLCIFSPGTSFQIFS